MANEENPNRWLALVGALEKLSESHRHILQLRYFGDCSYREMAEVLDIPEGTVMSRLYAARKALATLWRQEDL